MEIKLNSNKQIKQRIGIEPGGPVHELFTATCALHMDKYVPFRQGNLARTVVENKKVTGNVTIDTIEYSQQYAKYVYYGLSKSGKPLNYTTLYHKLAGPYWDKYMWSAEGEKVTREIERYMKRGGKK